MNTASEASPLGGADEPFQDGFFTERVASTFVDARLSGKRRRVYRFAKASVTHLCVADPVQRRWLETRGEATGLVTFDLAATSESACIGATRPTFRSG